MAGIQIRELRGFFFAWDIVEEKQRNPVQAVVSKIFGTLTSVVVVVFLDFLHIRSPEADNRFAVDPRQSRSDCQRPSRFVRRIK